MAGALQVDHPRFPLPAQCVSGVFTNCQEDAARHVADIGDVAGDVPCICIPDRCFAYHRVAAYASPQGHVFMG
jgi:hypothetical protein